jgi:hypothetical protein
VSFSPPKSIPHDEFTYPITECKQEEFVEGTMINLFYDGEWIVATKSNIGAQCTFYSSVTFHDLFYECFEACGLSIELLNKNYVYSFVMQHPLNKIVLDIPSPTLVLIQAYHIQGNTVYEVHDEYVVSKIRRPYQYTFSSQEEMITFLNGSSIKGVVLHHGTYRTKYYTPLYEKISQLRGNQASLHYQFLLLWKEGKTNDFLNYFPEHTADFDTYDKGVHTFIEQLYTHYKDCFMYKKKQHKEFPRTFKNHMYLLHQDYLTTRKSITRNHVIQYVKRLHASQLITNLRYFKEDLIRSST